VTLGEKKNQISLKLTAPLNVSGELMNTKRPVIERAYNVELKK
jgi:hypothetical protein